MRKRFSNRKIKITIEDGYFEDLKRNGVLITVWNKTGLFLRTCSVRSDELYEDIQSTLRILTENVNCPQARRWFRKEVRIL